MEFTQDLVMVQGILSGVVKTTGEFTRLKYKGGNEDKFACIISALKNHFVLKNYLPSNDKEHLYNVVYFLTINTDFNNKTLLETKDCEHLINIIPQLSVCLLVSVCMELDLTGLLCSVMEKVPPALTEELLQEVVVYLEHAKMDEVVFNTYLWADFVLTVVTVLDVTQNEELIDKISSHVAKMLMNISAMSSEHLPNLKTAAIHKRMGMTLLYVLKLLQRCLLHKFGLGKISDSLINVGIIIMKAVTLDVFCTWAEIDQETQSLQSVIAAEAYRVVEQLQKHKPGKELLQMLSTIAREPKSLSETIQSADTKTIIANINRGGLNQKQWFQALLIGNVFQDQDSIACIQKWTDLCVEADVSRLLDLAAQEKNPDAIKLVVDCASGLPTNSLALVINRFYRKHGIKNGFGGEKVQAQLTLVLNKMERKSLGTEVLILLLRNPELVLSLLYKECVKNSMYTECLANTYKLIKNIVEIEALHLNTLERVFADLPISHDNIPYCNKLLETLFDAEYFKYTDTVKKIIMPRLQARKELLGTLHLLVIISENRSLDEDVEELVEVLANIIEENRCTFFNFSPEKMEIVAEVVDFLMNARERSCFKQKACIVKKLCKNLLNRVYACIEPTTKENNFFSLVFPNFADFCTNSERVGKLVETLSSCVPSEWQSVACGVYDQNSVPETSTLLTDVLVLFADVAKSQPENSNATHALKHCVQQYGIFIKGTLQPKVADLNEDVCLTTNVCRLLRDLPEALKGTEGLVLARLPSDNSLRSLVTDKSFVCLLIAINDTIISKAIARRMLSK